MIPIMELHCQRRQYRFRLDNGLSERGKQGRMKDQTHEADKISQIRPIQ